MPSASLAARRCLRSSFLRGEHEVNLRLPSVKIDATLPTKGDGAGAVDFPRYTEVPGQRDSEANLGSRILTYIGLARKHKYLIIVVVVLFMFGGLIATMLTP